MPVTPNRFNLSARAGAMSRFTGPTPAKKTSSKKKPEPERQHKTYTQSEKKSLLDNYSVLPKSKWSTMVFGQHLRYLRTDGRFVRGGFLIEYFERDGKKTIRLANGFTPHQKGYATWAIALDQLAEIYTRNGEIASKPV